MDKLKGWAIGTVHKDPVKIVKPSGKVGFEMTICLDQFKMSDGRTFQQRVYVISFQRNAEAILNDLAPGTRVHVWGDVDAKAEESNGRAFASPRLIGEVELC